MTHTPLSGLRVLVVEDNFLVASVIVQHLRMRGAEVVGPAPSVARALELVDHQAFDAAILDIDLQGSIITPVALRVRGLGKPMVFLTGYGSDGVLPPELSGERRASKPIQMDDLTALVLEMAGRAPGAARPG